MQIAVIFTWPLGKDIVQDKNNNKRKPPAPEQNRTKIWMRLVVVIIAILALIYFLFSIKDNVDETADSTMEQLSQIVEEGTASAAGWSARCCFSTGANHWASG